MSGEAPTIPRRWLAASSLPLALCLVTACNAGGETGRDLLRGPDTGPDDAAPGAGANPGDLSGFNSDEPSVVTPGAGPGPSPGGSPGGAPMGAGTSREPIALDGCGDDNAAGFDAAQVEALRAGGDADGMRYLYPYDGTVFPRGMLAPEVMWEGADGSGVYVHIQASLFDYHGCLPVTAPGVLQLPQEVWEQAGQQTLGPDDPFSLELTVWTDGGPRGALVEQFVIAQATLKGSIYYNSYISAASFVGSIYRIPPGGQAEIFLGGFGCYGCHSVSANGERLISHTGGEPGLAYALDPSTQPNPPQLAPSPLAGFAGLSPDGTVYLAGAHPVGPVRPQGTPNEIALVNDAVLYETDTGAPMQASGIPPGAMMPMFSPDGTKVAFNDFGAGSGFGLAMMDFDPSTLLRWLLLRPGARDRGVRRGPRRKLHVRRAQVREPRRALHDRRGLLPAGRGRRAPEHVHRRLLCLHPRRAVAGGQPGAVPSAPASTARLHSVLCCVATAERITAGGAARVSGAHADR